MTRELPFTPFHELKPPELKKEEEFGVVMIMPHLEVSSLNRAKEDLFKLGKVEQKGKKPVQHYRLKGEGRETARDVFEALQRVTTHLSIQEKANLINQISFSHLGFNDEQNETIRRSLRAHLMITAVRALEPEISRPWTTAVKEIRKKMGKDKKEISAFQALDESLEKATAGWRGFLRKQLGTEKTNAILSKWEHFTSFAWLGESKRKAKPPKPKGAKLVSRRWFLKRLGAAGFSVSLALVLKGEPDFPISQEQKTATLPFSPHKRPPLPPRSTRREFLVSMTGQKQRDDSVSKKSEQPSTTTKPFRADKRTLVGQTQENPQQKEEIQPFRKKKSLSTMKDSEIETKKLKVNSEIITPVGKQHILPPEFEPSQLADLISFPFIRVAPGKESIQGHPEAVAALEKLFQAAQKAGVDDIYIGSAYRSFATQKYLWEKAGGKSQNHTAEPGTSEHHTGLAFDFTTQSIGYRIDSRTGFENTSTSWWLRENAHKFGFVLTYCRPGIDGIQQESWHYRYGSPELATRLFRLGYLDSNSEIDPIQFLAGLYHASVSNEA